MLQDDIQFGNDINNDFNGDEFDYPSRLTSIFVLIISLVLIGMDVLSLYYSYDYIKEASKKLSSILSEEQDVFDNMPEGLQSSYRGMCSEDAIDSMEEASEKLDEVIELLDDIV